MKLFIGNIPYSWTSDMLCAQVSVLGKISWASVKGEVFLNDVNRSCGFGWVEVDDGAALDLLNQNGNYIEGRKIAIRPWESSKCGRIGGAHEPRTGK